MLTSLVTVWLLTPEPDASRGRTVTVSTDAVPFPKAVTVRRTIRSHVADASVDACPEPCAVRYTPCAIEFWDDDVPEPDAVRNAVIVLFAVCDDVPAPEAVRGAVCVPVAVDSPAPEPEAERMFV
jgi:hypothetical protein